MPSARVTAALAAFGERLARGRVGPVCIAILGFATFASTLGHGFVFDDGWQILDNPWIWSPSYLPELLTRPVWGFLNDGGGNYYRPVMSLLHFGAAAIFGHHAFGFHLVAVLMHALSAAMALVFLRRLVSGGVALFAAALFAVHPIHAESVAWISGSPDVNVTVFILLTLTLWDRARESSRPVLTSWAAAAAFLLALLSKEIAVVTPVLALLLPRATPARPGPETGRATPARRPVIGRVAGWSVAFVLPLGLYLAARSAALGSLRPIVARPELTGLPGLATALMLVPRYLFLAVLPLHPAPDHVVQPSTALLDARVLAGAAVLLVAVALFPLLRRRSPGAAFGVALFLLPLAPALRVAYFSGTLQADRYLYLPALGLCLIVAVAGGAIWRRCGRVAADRASLAGRTALAVAGAILVLAGAGRAATAAAVWRDSETLGRAGIALEPRSLIMRLELIHALDAKGRRAEALAVAEEAVALAPADPRAAAAIAGLRARMLEDQGEDPIAVYRSALQADPSRAHLWVGLSEACLRAGKPQDAIDAAQRALAIEPYNRSALVNLGTARGQAGDPAGQEREARRLLAIDPDSAAGHMNLGAARLQQDDLDGAERALTRAAGLDPALARVHLYLSWIAFRRARPEDALREAERAVTLDARDAEAWNHLGAMRAEAGDRDGAREAWQKTLAVRPGDPQAQANLRRLTGPGTPVPR